MAASLDRAAIEKSVAAASEQEITGEDMELQESHGQESNGEYISGASLESGDASAQRAELAKEVC